MKFSSSTIKAVTTAASRPTIKELR